MSDGGRESRRDSAPDLSTKSEAGDDFGRAASKIAVAQICGSVGFQGFRDSALEGLAEIAIRYLSDLGKTANFYANLAGRTESNLFDIIQGLDDMGFSQGFSGASEANRCLSRSGTVRKISEYVGSAEEIPFAQPIPRFPVFRTRKRIPSFMQMGEAPPSKHMPAWLPALPDPHTYIHTPVWNEREPDPRAEKVEQARQRRKAERSLLTLQQRLLSCDPVADSALAEQGDAANALRMAESNPFLAAANSTPLAAIDEARASSAAEEDNPFLAMPLQPGEKDVSAVVLPAKFAPEPVVENHVSVLDAFAPAIQAAKDGFVDCVNGGERNDLPDKRPSVHFKFRTAKKFLGESLDLSFKDKDASKRVKFISRNDGRDEKKRRAELILRQSMENPQELTQL